MSKNTTVNLRVDPEVKKQAGEILASLGLTFSDAFNLLLHQVRIQRELPFAITTHSQRPNTKILSLINSIENGEAEMIGPFETFDDFKNSLGGADEV